MAHTTKFEALLELGKSLGVEYIDAVCQGGNAQYTSRDFLQETLQTLADTIRAPFYHAVKESPCYSMVIDETTDLAVCKDLIVYAKYLDNSHTEVTSFLGILQLHNGEVETIYKVLVSKYGVQEGLDFQRKLVALGSDGANVMVCKHGEVARRLQSDAPHLVSNHCVARRLALASAQAANDI